MQKFLRRPPFAIHVEYKRNWLFNAASACNYYKKKVGYISFALYAFKILNYRLLNISLIWCKLQSRLTTNELESNWFVNCPSRKKYLVSIRGMWGNTYPSLGNIDRHWNFKTNIPWLCTYQFTSGLTSNIDHFDRYHPSGSILLCTLRRKEAFIQRFECL